MPSTSLQACAWGGKETAIDDSSFAVELAPGAGETLEIGMRRYANGPTFAFPWDR